MQTPWEVDSNYRPRCRHCKKEYVYTANPLDSHTEDCPWRRHMEHQHVPESNFRQSTKKLLLENN